MKNKLSIIKEKIAKAKSLPVFKAGQKAEIAEQVIEDCSQLLGEIIERVEKLEAK